MCAFLERIFFEPCLLFRPAPGIGLVFALSPIGLVAEAITGFVFEGFFNLEIQPRK